jgi:distribution and morphology protein 10
MLQVRGVSDASLPNGGNVLGILHNDHGKYTTEYLFSTDSALCGIRAMYNFGADPRELQAPTVRKALSSEVMESITPSLFSLGFEMYYGLLNKSAGVSTGLRFTTLPAHSSFPYTMTLTLNPLMGNLSSTYSVKAGRYLALCSRFDFNFYSYESGVMLGCELWRLKRKPLAPLEKLEMPLSSSTPEDPMIPDIEENPKPQPTETSPTSNSILETFKHGFISQAPNDEDVAGILKARIDQDWKIGLLWEGKFKELIFSVGTSLDLKKRERIFGGLGLEVQYSS